MIGKRTGLGLLVLLAAAGCVSPPTRGGPEGPSSPPVARTLSMVVNVEVSNLSAKATGPWAPARTTRIFNAELSILDAQDEVRPYLAEALPQLDTDSWQVSPDRTMETTWKLRAGLTWQDGQPLTADDFVFAFQVYRMQELSGFFDPRPQNLVDRVVAIDPQTIRIRWRSPFLHQGEGLPPLPRHILAEPFAAVERDPSGHSDAFTALRYWTTEYVGAGPYKLTSWEPASHIEGEAFDGHALGKPRIERVLIRIIPNNDTALANMMAGEVHLTMTQSLRFEHAMTLQQHGGFNDTEGKGKLIFAPTSVNVLVPQHRPEYQQTPALFNVRTRKAIAHATDRDAINDRLFLGKSPIPISFVLPRTPYYAEVDRAIAKYPYDPRRTEQLMLEAGHARDRDGFFTDIGGPRFQPSLWNSADAIHQTAAAIVLDNWRRAGIDAQAFLMPAAMERDQEARSTWPGIIIYTMGGNPEQSAFNNMVSEKISSPANRWAGSNRGGWSHPDFDLLWERYNATLSRAEQIQHFVQLMKLHSELLPNYPLYFALNVISHVSTLKGPDGHSSHWNIHEWELAP